MQESIEQKHMYIRRDYSQPFFSRRRRRGFWRWLLLYVVGIGGFLWLVDSQFAQLQNMALNAIGQAPEPTPFASELATEGLNAYGSGRMNEATELMAQALEQQPTNVDYLYEYGRLLIESDRVEEAIDIGQRAIDANPNDPRGYAIRARAMDLSGDSANAIPVAQAGLQIDQFFAPLYVALSSAYGSINRYQQAIEAGERAVELDGNDPSARRVYAFALINVGERDAAIAQLEQAVSLNPNATSPYFELAFQYRASQRFEEAIATYEAVLAMGPDETVRGRAYLRLCQTYFTVRDDAQAVGYCDDAITTDPTNAEAYAQRGQVRYSRRNYEGAIQDLDQCVALGSDRIECWYIRGLAHYYIAECDQAWVILNESLTMMTQRGIGEGPLDSTLSGLRLITDNCTGYVGRALPTPIPPTAIPPTPIGG
jgi:tetratricopeptide (TPR) repeat protein